MNHNCCLRNLCMLDENILYICHNEYWNFLNKKNVVGIGLGYKFIKGVPTCIKCIVVLVSKKNSINELTSKDIIPKVYKGILTDVMETGGINMSCSLNKRIRPVEGGYSIGSATNKEFGSLACLVTNGHLKYILANNHVIANENKASLGSHVLQPGIKDGGVVSKDTIANLSKYMPLKFFSLGKFPENYVDCAIAEITNSSIVSSKIAYIGIPKGTKIPKLNENVQKVGRTTERTLGKIISVGFTSIIKYDSGKALFRDLIVTTKMSDNGDSGSLLMDDKGYGIGLLCSDTPSNTFYNPIQMVLSILDVKIVTK
ncbi:hypothetical protein ADU80_12280 [Clostridium botulinum]|uniref:Peptidase S1 domain-containing protein n=2 Tax=Clostridium botulinum TaxID=1491 RepID=A0A9Q1UW77_CLOBO|nr:trypsin-like serine protease [Clostridium botulinum]KEI02449.1 hypothetical protein Y848_07690 [Clostridium botulinum C/D str. Sp77]KOA77706.1 hypothetical protein ADU77_07260 [Clostridium botulinum]KOA82316.1 hypothetical protein ADU75_12990 [Clostridium botulinum]KOA83343.1 hypothetical protein ADU80_12280 [Clostridium botulinum]KOA83685.1 hypothetical protein ADU74_11940 [Clostridium botulinum]